MVTKTIEDERSAITADVTLCDACGNPVEEANEYYKKSDIDTEWAVQRATENVANDTVKELYEEWGKPVRETHVGMDGNVHERPIVGFELRDKVYVEDVMEDVDTALYDAVRDAQEKYQTPDPTFELCSDCQDGVEHNMALIEPLLFETEPETSDFDSDSMIAACIFILLVSVIGTAIAIVAGLSFVPYAVAGLVACIIMIVS